MKKTSILTGIMITFYFTACCTSSISSHTEPIAVRLVQNENDKGTGANPEVYNIHQCLKLEEQAKRQCFNGLLPTNTYLVLHPSSGSPLLLAGRSNGVEKRTIKFNNNDNKFILYLDTSHIKGALTCNIQTAQYSKENHTLVIAIDIKDIGSQIILTDSDGHVVLDYTIIKE